ncbi:MAG: LysM peptidoglycan-binding domain-containing protein [Verrucomicrobiota bacterium JB023]|nr:LysM peptidoglycan-binding domain-containing protein [Verrucomicrobiota bacterium JB023]
MKTKLFETKRRATSGGFRFLHAKTRRRKKQRVAAAASNGDFAVEEPNLGVARGLVVILLLHVAAIAAIVVHNQSTKSDVVVKEPVEAANKSAVAETEKPKLNANDQPYFVEPGDTYERIARNYGLDSDYLRRFNGNVPLSANLALKLPAGAQRIEVIENEEEAMAMEQLPPIREVAPSHSMPPEYELLSEPEPIGTPLPPTLGAAPVQALPTEPVRTTVPSEPVAQVAPPVVEEKPKPAPMRTHTLSSGETVWSLSRRYGVSQQEILSLNGIKDARKMRIGMKLKIPAQ